MLRKKMTCAIGKIPTTHFAMPSMADTMNPAHSIQAMPMRGRSGAEVGACGVMDMGAREYGARTIKDSGWSKQTKPRRRNAERGPPLRSVFAASAKKTPPHCRSPARVDHANGKRG